MGDVATRLRTTSYIFHVDAILRVQPLNLGILISLHSLRLGFFAVCERGVKNGKVEEMTTARSESWVV